MISINGNRGLVSKITDSGRTVVIDLPKGGSIRAPNMGAFEIGDEVAFTLDASGRRVVTVMPIEMANWYKAMGENKIMQLSLKEDQHGTILYLYNDPDNGQVIEVSADLSRGKTGESDPYWGDNCGNEHLYDHTDGPEGEGGVLLEEPRETDNLLVQVLHGYGGIEEVGGGPEESILAGGYPISDAEGD
jgi:hypothetical protein